MVNFDTIGILNNQPLFRPKSLYIQSKIRFLLTSTPFRIMKPEMPFVLYSELYLSNNPKGICNTRAVK